MSITSLTLPGDRILDVEVDGPSDGEVVLLHHGTPGSSVLFDAFVRQAASRGLRLATYSRPGYGSSTRRPGRSVADCASDAATVLDSLGAERAFLAGWSGGGPHALACTALIPERARSVATIAGAGPFGVDGLNFLEGMGKENIEEFGAAVAGPEELRGWMEANAGPFAKVTAEEIVDALGDLVSGVDQAALTGELGGFLAESIREGLRTGYWGWFDDDLAFVRDWGFDLSSIRVPVAVWQGSQDRMVPLAHGEWLAAHVPGVRAHLEPEHGHLSLAVGSFGRNLDDLLDMAGS